MARDLDFRVGHGGPRRGARRRGLPKQTGGSAPWWLIALPLPVMMVLGALAYPAFQENAEDSCAALERRVAAAMLAPRPVGEEPYREAMLRGSARALVQDGMDGRLGAAAAARRFTSVPPQIGCSVGYWRLAMRPGEAAEWLAAMGI
jgi:hypothetical protein